MKFVFFLFSIHGWTKSSLLSAHTHTQVRASIQKLDWQVCLCVIYSCVPTTHVAWNNSVRVYVFVRSLYITCVFSISEVKRKKEFFFVCVSACVCALLFSFLVHTFYTQFVSSRLYCAVCLPVRKFYNVIFTISLSLSHAYFNDMQFVNFCRACAFFSLPCCFSCLILVCSFSFFGITCSIPRCAFVGCYRSSFSLLYFAPFFFCCVRARCLERKNTHITNGIRTNAEQTRCPVRMMLARCVGWTWFWRVTEN